jgi:hypothetical protein
MALLLCGMSFVLSVTNKAFMLGSVTNKALMLSVIMLNVIMLSVVMLNVVAPRLKACPSKMVTTLLANLGLG